MTDRKLILIGSGSRISGYVVDEAGCMKICDEEYREAEKKCDPMGNFKNSENKQILP